MVDNLLLVALTDEENTCPIIDKDDRTKKIIDAIIIGVILWLILAKR